MEMMHYQTSDPLLGESTCSHETLNFLDFIPCFRLIISLVPKNVFSSCPIDPENLCAVPFIPENVYHCSPYVLVCFTFLFIVEKKSLSNRLFLLLEMRSCCTSTAVSVISNDSAIVTREKDKIIFLKL